MPASWHSPWFVSHGECQFPCIPWETDGPRNGTWCGAASYRWLVATTCDLCGAADPGDDPPLTWSLTMERGQVKRYCEQCTRQHVRAMEGKLDQEHW